MVSRAASTALIIEAQPFTPQTGEEQKTAQHHGSGVERMVQKNDEALNECHLDEHEGEADDGEVDHDGVFAQSAVGYTAPQHRQWQQDQHRAGDPCLEQRRAHPA